MPDTRSAWKDAASCNMELKNTFVFAVLLCLTFCPIFTQELKGRNVCKIQGSLGFQCCPGWSQLGDECLTPLCEGNFTCKENEVCVRPNECRCRHGYFGASCDTKCPSQFWGPDCKGKCMCHPNGQCDDVTGECTCNPNRWGPNCENACSCQKGKCDQATGKCSCNPGAWGPQCSQVCYCSVNSVCEQTAGRCICNPGYYGRNCGAQCACNGSPCEQFTGRCQCRERLWGPRCERYCQCVHGRCNPTDGSCTCSPGYRGKFCREPCPAGFYGQNCRHRCGHCKGQQPCKVTEGRCVTCEQGWNGTKCDQMCAPGFFGENCKDVCPPCKDGHFCSRFDGKCSHCNPGWTGDRCETRCPNGTYGENCDNNCSHCFNGNCHFETGECLCDAGFHGTFCNLTCESGQYGVNCAQTCPCHDQRCNPISGACNLLPNQRMGVIAAGSLVTFLLLVLLSLLCCCFLCKKRDENNPESSTSSQKAKRLLCGRFSRISTKLPRIPLRRQKLPKVVGPENPGWHQENIQASGPEEAVAHHDPENAFNCRFIEPPSAVEQHSPSWSSQESFSSFENSDDGPVYCIPHEDSVAENKDKGYINGSIEKTGSNDEDAGEYTSLKDTGSSKQSTAENFETPLLKSADSDGSMSGSESAAGAVYAQVSKQSKDEDGKPPSPGRAKPRPPDPSTKPKVSWIHGTVGANQAEKGQVTAKEKKRSTSDVSVKSEEKHRMKEKSSKHREQRHAEAKDNEGSQSLSKQKANKSRPGQEQIEHINGAVQNALKKIGNFHLDRKGGDSQPPKSPSKVRSEVIPPNVNSEAATLLAAQLKEKTQSINRNEGTLKPNGFSTPQAQREKPTPPQKAKRSSAGMSQNPSKPLLPTSSNLQKMVAPVSETLSHEPKSTEKLDSNSSGAGDGGESTPKKTPIKKPPRKKGKEGTLDSETKIHPKIAIMPPQMVK